MKTTTLNSKPQILVFGLDQSGKPQAGRFAADLAEVARQAATSLNLTARDIGQELEAIAKQVPVGRIHARGKAFIPYIKRELYDQLCAACTASSAKDEAAGKSPIERSLAYTKAEQGSALPADWEAIAPGHMVLLQESLPDGWFEAIVVSRDNEVLTLRLRDYPKYPNFIRHIRSVGLVHPGLA